MVVRRCLIHVGAPKTGTTYLQLVLGRNQQTLALRGLLYPGTSPSHDAALDLRGVSFGRGVQTRPAYAWDRLAGEVADGWCPFLLPISGLDPSTRVLEEGARRADPGGTLPTVAPSIPTAVSPSSPAPRAASAPPSPSASRVMASR